MKFKGEPSINQIIQKLNHGNDILSLFKGFTPAQFHNLVASIVGVGMGVAGLYMALRGGNMEYFSMPWASERRDSSEIYVAGLQNLGNNCFLNVILQALPSCSCFHPFLQNILAADNLIEEKAEKMPLTVALNSLLKDLCIIRDEKTVLSPRRVMLAMGLYVSTFNLTRQQDASEAFLHLLSSLEVETSKCYVPHGSSLADISASPSRVHKQREGQNECERWQNYIVGPFDGTSGSILTCKSCSSMLSMDFEFFRCLPLSPVLDKSAEIIDGCTVVDCLKHFTAAEHVENYRCSRCWHIAALKYLSLKTEKDEAKIKKLGHCVELDSCDCKSLFLQEEITWTGFSHAFKQLSIARCPKILCIHLQRASINGHGELIKIQGHISFPMVLDLFPFTEAARTAGHGTLEENMQKQWKLHQQPMIAQLSHLNMRREMQILPHTYRILGEEFSLDALSRNKLGSSIYQSSGDPSIETTSGCYNSDMILGSKMVASDIHHSQACSMSEPRSDKKVITVNSSSSESYMYCLSSVVEHYGRFGGGHYAVYRRVASELGADDSVGVGPLETVNQQWFYVSDHEVSSVSEESVLAAEASLLFYERIEAHSRCSFSK